MRSWPAPVSEGEGVEDVSRCRTFGGSGRAARGGSDGRGAQGRPGGRTPGRPESIGGHGRALCRRGARRADGTAGAHHRTAAALLRGEDVPWSVPRRRGPDRPTVSL